MIYFLVPTTTCLDSIPLIFVCVVVSVGQVSGVRAGRLTAHRRPRPVAPAAATPPFSEVETEMLFDNSPSKHLEIAINS